MRFMMVPAEVRHGQVTCWCIYDNLKQRYVGLWWLTWLLGFSLVRLYTDRSICEHDVDKLNGGANAQ